MSKSNQKSNWQDECPELIFKLATPDDKPKTVFKCDTIELCSNTLDIDVSGCCKKKISIENSDFIKKLPIQSGQSVAVGDLVTIAKTGDQMGIRKPLCEQWEWAAAVDADSSISQSSITVDNCGNVYVSGIADPETNQPIFYDTGPDGITLNTPNIFGKTTSGNTQIFVGKLKPTGKWEWTAAVDGGSSELRPSIATDSCGNIYVSGQVNESNAPIFYDAGSDGSTLTNSNLIGKPTSGFTQVFVGKLKPTGKWEWATSVDGDQNDQNSSITTDSCGNIYVSGYVTGGSNQPLFYDAGPDGNTLTIHTLTGKNADNNNSFQIFIGKLKPTGKWDWAAAVDGNSDEFNPSIVADNCGNVYVSGVSGVSQNGNAPVFYNAGPDGNTLNSPNIVGKMTAGGNSTTQIFVGKIKSNGIWEWAAAVDGNSNENISSITADSCGNIYVAGIVQGSTEPLFYDAGSDGSTLTNSNLVGKIPIGGNFGLQTFIGKLKTNGKWEWAASVDGISAIRNPFMDTDSCGNIYVSGHAEGRNPPMFYDAGLDGNTLATFNLTGRTRNINTDSQLFAAKLAATGKWIWAVSIDNDINVINSSVTVDNCGNVYISGDIFGVDAPMFYNAGPDGSTLTTHDLLGKSSNNSIQVSIGKLANDPRTNAIFGIVQSVDQANNCALVEFGGVITTNETLVPGCPYYIDSYGPVDPNASKLTTEECSDCNCPNRCIGVAIDENSIIWNVEDPLCVKPKCCCCCQHLETNQQEF